MSIRVVLWILVCSIAVCSCLRVDKELDNRKIIDFSENANQDFNSSILSYRVLSFESKEGAIINRIHKVLYEKNRYFIISHTNNKASVLFIFDNNGKYLTKLDKSGRGPGEYIQFSDFDIDAVNDLIVVADASQKKILEYDFYGSFVSARSLNISPSGICKIVEQDSTNTYILDTRFSHTSSSKGYLLNQLNDKWRVTKKYLEYRNTISVFLGSPYSLQKIGNTVSYFKPYSNEVYAISHDDMYHKYSIEFPQPVLSMDDKFLDRREQDILTKFITYRENKNWVSCKFKSNNEYYIGFYNKNQDKSIVYRDVAKESCDCGTIITPVGFIDDSYILCVYPKNLEQTIQLIDSKLEKCENLQHLKEILQNNDLSNNPYLLFINLNQDVL